MQHERHAHRLPCAAGKLGAMRRRRGRQALARDVREHHAAALEHVAVLDHARDAAAAFRTRPLVAAERAAVDRFQPRDDALLQAGEVAADRADVASRASRCTVALRGAIARWPMSVRYCMPSKWMADDRGVRGALRLPHRVAERRHAQHAPAAHDGAAVRQRGARVKHVDAGCAASVTRSRPPMDAPLLGASG